MRLMIDTASLQEIEEAMTWGIDAVTANATMYRKEAITLYEFLTHVEALPHSFLSAEVIGSYEEMYKQALSLHEQYPDVVIKINYSAEGLRLAGCIEQETDHNRYDADLHGVTGGSCRTERLPVYFLFCWQK